MTDMMAAMLPLTFLLPLLLLCFATISVFAQGEPTDTECVFKVGEKYFDLRAISSSDSIITQNEFYYLQLNPCKPITISNGGTTCPAGTLICQLSAGTNAPAYLWADEISFAQMSYDGTTLSITYTGGAYCPNTQTYRQATIKFTCGSTTGTPVWVSETSCAHTLIWVSSAACALSTAPGSEPGSAPGSGSAPTSPSLSPLIIVVIVISGLVGLVGLVLLIWLVKSRYFKVYPDTENDGADDPLLRGNTSQHNYDSSYNRSVNQESDPPSAIQVAESAIVSSFVLSKSDDILIPFASLKLGAVLGQGHFGQVQQADYTGAQVAVKKSKGIDEKLILEEATMMKNLPPHPNVLHYYGVSQENGEFMMVTELCDKGNLAQYLRNPKNNLTSEHCRQFCRQIASGMWHISKYGIVHRDLRAENILLSGAELKAKVADFGLARSLNSHDQNDLSYYRMSELKPIPIAWTPPEVLNKSDQLKYFAASDVWSFGVVMWEIYSRGAKPFDKMNVNVVINIVTDQYRTTPLLPRPNKCPDYIFNIMNSCWAFNPQHRPSFERMYNQLS